MTVTYSVGVGGVGTVPLGDVVYLGDNPGYTSRADGSTGMSGVLISDGAGALDIVGLNKYEVDDTACDNPRIFTGVIYDRTVLRGSAQRVGTQRVWNTNLADQNAYLNLRIIHDGNHGNRPAETDVQRIAWLLDDVLNNGHVINGTGGAFGANGPTTAVLAAPRNLDAADYRGQYAADVLADIGPPGNRRFFVYWDPDLEDKCLFYGLNTDYLGTSTLAISNVLADLDATTFWPYLRDASLDRDPSAVYGAVYYKYRNGTIYREDPATLTQYLDRGVSINNDRVGSATTASIFVDRILDKASNERDQIDVMIRVPPEHVNHVLEGQRISVKFSHLPGYESPVYMHVLSRTVIQDKPTPEFYDIRLELCDYVGGFGTGGSGSGSGSVAAPPHVPQQGEGGPGDLYAWGDNQVIYYINGVVVGDNSTGTHSTLINVADGIIVGGDNVLAMHVTNGIEPISWAGGNETFIEARLFPDGSSIPYVYSTTAAKIWEVENLAGALGGTPTDWNEASFDDSGWDDGIDVTGTSPNLIAAAPIAPARLIAPPDALAGTHARGLVWLARMNFTVASLGLTAPQIGQYTTESLAGLTAGTDYTLNYPYAPGSLRVTVDGLAVTATEVDPDAGTFELGFDATGRTVVVTYQVAAPVGTGTVNPQPTPSPTLPSSGAPSTADYLVGTAHAGLSAEIVVGTIPGGELGGTWAAPTVDAVHAGTAHITSLDGLSDVVITSPVSTQAIRYDGSQWVNSSGIWRPLMDGAGNVITDAAGEAVMALSS